MCAVCSNCNDAAPSVIPDARGLLLPELAMADAAVDCPFCVGARAVRMTDGIHKEGLQLGGGGVLLGNHPPNNPSSYVENIEVTKGRRKGRGSRGCEKLFSQQRG